MINLHPTEICLFEICVSLVCDIIILVCNDDNVLFQVIATYSDALDYENEYGPDYGTKWLLFLDENGTTHHMNFSTLPQESRGIRLGGVYFYLFTRQNIDTGELLTVPIDDSPIQSTYFNASNDIKALTHGWLSKTTGWLRHMKNALVKSEDQNIIAVDWSELAQNPIYPWPAFSTRYVGKRVAKLIESLVNTYKLQDPNIHLIGHSLGAHVMGYAGMFSQQKVRRITGLDPARPLFEIPMMSTNFRLDKSDAEFVDIIHTCSGIYGYQESHGHADFYPNSGKPRQPGCDGNQQAIEGCSHGRSIEFFMESIEATVNFMAYPCDNWSEFNTGKCRSNATVMGYPAKSSRTGDFFLHTKNQSKYAMDN